MARAVKKSRMLAKSFSRISVRISSESIVVGSVSTGREERRTVDLHLAVSNNLPDLTLLLEVLKALAGKRAVDLETVDEGGDGDKAVGLDVLVELVGSGLVKDDGVLSLVLDFGW